MKAFKASTLLSFSVTLSDGSRVRIEFNPLTEGGTVFYTDDEELVKALERHPYFGELFEKDDTQEEVSTEESTEPENVSIPSGGSTPLSFANEEDAKEYIANKYGVSRTRLKTRASIERAAVELGMTIEWEGRPSETEEPAE